MSTLDGFCTLVGNHYGWFCWCGFGYRFSTKLVTSIGNCSIGCFIGCYRILVEFRRED